MGEFKEDIVYDDMNVRITTLRVTFKAETVPIDKVQKIDFRMKVVNLVMSSIAVLVSLPSPMLMGSLGYLIISVFFCWAIWAYMYYSELWIIADDGKPHKIVTGSIGNSKYMHMVADKLQSAITISKQLQERGDFDYTETMKFAQKMKQFEH